MSKPDQLVQRQNVRTTTAKRKVGQVLQFASYLVGEGVPRDNITSLSVLTQPAHFRLGLEHQRRRLGLRPTSTQYKMARMLLAIGRHWTRVQPEDLRWMHGIARALHVRQLRMNDKNRNVLRQFDEPASIDMLLKLPGRLAPEAEKVRARGARRKSALLMQRAVAIELLLVAPIRYQNLVSLEIVVHLRRMFVCGEQKLTLLIPAHQVKNGVSLEFDLPNETIDLVVRYVHSFRADLTQHGGTMLFPGAVDAHKGAYLGRSIKSTIRRYRLVYAPSRIPTLAAKLYLTKRPNDYLPISLLLGHKSVDTTRAYYCELEMKPAARKYAHEVLGKTFA